MISARRGVLSLVSHLRFSLERYSVALFPMTSGLPSSTTGISRRSALRYAGAGIAGVSLSALLVACGGGSSSSENADADTLRFPLRLLRALILARSPSTTMRRRALSFRRPSLLPRRTCRSLSVRRAHRRTRCRVCTIRLRSCMRRLTTWC